MRTGQHLEAFSTTFGLVASAAIHLAAFAYLASATAQFNFDFEIALPAEVEFGLTGEMDMAAAPAPPRATGAPDPRWAGQLSQDVEHPTLDAGVPMDAGPDADADADAISISPVRPNSTSAGSAISKSKLNCAGALAM